MIKILDNTKTLSQLALDTSNGLGAIMPIEAYIDEELNGIYEAEIRVAISDKHFKDLAINGLMRMKVNDTDNEQIFRIYSMDKNIDNTCTIRLRHITYDLIKVPVQPFTATGAVSVKNSMIANMLVAVPFTMSTDISNTTSTFKLDIPRSFRECLGGYEGSILDVFRCEYKWDNLNVGMLARRGADNGVRIAYGKNLTDFEQEENNTEVYDGVLGYAIINDTTYVGNIYNKTGATLPKVKLVDFSENYDENNLPTPASLTTDATTYATNNSIEVPNVNITVSFINLAQTEEYKNILPLERVVLGDTVHIYFDKLGVEASSRVIRTRWNCLLEKYDEIELGDTKANLNSVIDDSVNTSITEAIKNLDVDVDLSVIEAQLDQISSYISDGLGLYKTVDASGRIYLHNEPTLALSQKQYQITANGFQMSNDYGQTWTSGWTIDGNAVFHELSSNTLTALEIYGSYIEGTQMLFGDLSTTYVKVEPYFDSNNNPLGVQFDGNGSIKMSIKGSYNLINYDPDYDITWNEFGMTGSNTINQIRLRNYDNDAHLMNAINLYWRHSSGIRQSSIQLMNNDIDLSNPANMVYLLSNADDISQLRLVNYKGSINEANAIDINYKYYDDIGQLVNANRIYIKNYDYSTTYLSNYISMTSDGSYNTITIDNHNVGADTTANSIKLDTNGGIEIYNAINGNAINLNSSGIELTNGGGYIQITSSNSIFHSAHDLELTCADDIRITSASGSYIRLNTSELQIEIGGNRHVMSFMQTTIGGTTIKYLGYSS